MYHRERSIGWNLLSTAFQGLSDVCTKKQKVSFRFQYRRRLEEGFHPKYCSDASQVPSFFRKRIVHIDMYLIQLSIVLITSCLFYFVNGDTNTDSLLS